MERSWNTLFLIPLESPLQAQASGPKEVDSGRTVFCSAVLAMDKLVAIALFGEDISPRFCQARGVDLYRWDGEKAHLQGHVLLGETCYPDRLEMLASRKVELLMCGAFPCDKAPMASRLGINVVCGLFGPASEIVRCLGTILGNQTKSCD